MCRRGGGQGCLRVCVCKCDSGVGVLRTERTIRIVLYTGEERVKKVKDDMYRIYRVDVGGWGWVTIVEWGGGGFGFGFEHGRRYITILVLVETTTTNYTEGGGE